MKEKNCFNCLHGEHPLPPEDTTCRDCMGFSNYKQQEKKPFILCAAIWYNDGITRPNLPSNVATGVVICGRRHSNCRSTANLLIESPLIDKLVEVMCGYLTSDDRFVDRREAGEIAYAAGQISEKVANLSSCDLY